MRLSRGRPRKRFRVVLAAAALLAALLTPIAAPAAGLAAIAPGFVEDTVWSGLTNPTVVRFAADGRVFVAEKSGAIKIFDNLADTTPTTFTGLQTNVHDYWDRGLLGLALDPSMTGGTGSGSYVYVLYAYDHILGSGGTAPRWGDTCPTPPGATTDGCVISGRLSRFAVSGSTISGPEQVLLEDWCQQFPSHSLGTLAFGPDGALYVSAGDGANFNTVDYGQFGGTTTPIVTAANPCGDPPTEGGALRSQDARPGAPANFYRATVLADGPISYWRLGETSGTAAADELGVHAGTYVGGPALGAPGALADDTNTAVGLNGSSQSVTIAGSSAFQFSGTQPFSAEVWFKHTPDGVYRRIVSSERSDNQGWQLYSQDGSYGFVRWGATASEIGSGVAIGAGWHYFVGTYDGANMRAFIDGVEMPGSPLASSVSLPSDTTFAIGKRSDGVSFFNGWVDEPAIYGYALTPAQIAAHYAAGISTGNTDPTGLDGSILRIDPATGAGMPGNPFAGSADPNTRRIIAYGLRNPFRITMRPGTNELWIGDVGWATWEEIDRISNMSDSVAENFGWPCYEGAARQGGYDSANLALCESLYGQGPGAVTAPILAYDHAAQVVAGETCPIGSSAVTGMAFYPESGGSFPAAYAGGLFFADHSRNCIWFIPKGSGGQLDTAAVQTFVAPAANPVDLVVGPGAALFYADFDGGTIRRIQFSGGNLPPTAVIGAVPSSGPAPLTVQFDAGGSSDPEGTALTYAWDLDGDGQYNDGTAVTATRTYASPGNVVVGLRVTDAGNATGSATRTISVANSPPVPVISAPTAALSWSVGDAIAFSGSATDPQDGVLPASALSWSLVLQHCPSNCHTHTIQTWPGVASGSFSAPDHDYPSYLELTLTATDSLGTTASTTVRLDPRTVVLSFATVPTGLALAVNQASSIAPFSRTVIVGSSNTVSATTPQILNGASYAFSSWSDGLGQTHQVVAPATNTTYTATYTTTSLAFTPVADAEIRSNKAKSNFGTAATLRVRVNQARSYLKFTVTGLTGAATSAKLRVWVTDQSSAAGSVYLVSSSWTETGITWNNAPAISGTALSTVGSAPGGTWVEFNLGSSITGNGTYSFAISGGGTDVVEYASRESSNDPVLIVTG